MDAFLALKSPADNPSWNPFPHAQKEADNAVAELEDPVDRRLFLDIDITLK